MDSSSSTRSRSRDNNSSNGLFLLLCNLLSTRLDFRSRDLDSPLPLLDLVLGRPPGLLEPPLLGDDAGMQGRALCFQGGAGQRRGVGGGRGRDEPALELGGGP